MRRPPADRLGRVLAALRKSRAHTACGVNITASRSAHLRKAVHWPIRCASRAKAYSASMAVGDGRGGEEQGSDHSPSGSARPARRCAATKVLRMQHGDGHRADAARHRRDRAGDFGGFVEGDVADEAALAVVGRHAVDADVDDRRAGLDPVAADHLGPADGGDDDVGAADDAGRSRVREWAMVTVQLSPSSSCAIGLPTMLERPTRPRRGRQVAELLLEQIQAAERRAGHERVRARWRAGRRSPGGSRRRPWPGRSSR